MPTYEYLCSSCGNKFEVFQGIGEDPVNECSSCGKSVKRIITGGAGFIMKDGGNSFELPSCGSKTPCCADGVCGRHDECH